VQPILAMHVQEMWTIQVCARYSKSISTISQLMSGHSYIMHTEITEKWT